MRRLAAAATLAVLLGGTGWIATRALGAEGLEVGEEMPALTYRGPAGSAELSSASGDPAVVVLWDPGCGHCGYTLDGMEREAGRLEGVRLYLLTPADPLPIEMVRARWSRLAAAPNVEWGSVSMGEFRRRFGVSATPAFFFFGRDGALRGTTVGEAKVDYLLSQVGG